MSYYKTVLTLYLLTILYLVILFSKLQTMFNFFFTRFNNILVYVLTSFNNKDILKIWI